jgi:hypothetical protein
MRSGMRDGKSQASGIGAPSDEVRTSVDHPLPEDIPYGTGVRVMPIRGDAVRRHPGHGPRGAKEGLRRGEIPRGAEAHVHEIPLSIDGAVEIAPAPLHADVRLVHIPTSAHDTAPFLHSVSLSNGANLLSQSRTASCVKMMPRWRNISAKSRRLSL